MFIYACFYYVRSGSHCIYKLALKTSGMFVCSDVLLRVYSCSDLALTLISLFEFWSTHAHFTLIGIIHTYMIMSLLNFLQICECEFKLIGSDVRIQAQLSIFK